ncbi:hypothetical protein [Priestia endophytica]|uniref:hypothetical protein n=1 Tax=Priestia endophytica TaxID=135735 RepID=UPI00203DFA79|nr:hypothetical protein [Priestia endophytica]MCM3537771.1 hypothetical protein [Priestia endophytica]
MNKTVTNKNINLNLAANVIFVASLLFVILGICMKLFPTPYSMVVTFCWLLPSMGGSYALSGQKGIFRYIGIYGNLLIVLCTTILPAIILFIMFS